MRWLIGLLLLGNVVLFLWTHSLPDAGRDAHAPPPDVGEIRLLDRPGRLAAAAVGEPDGASSAATDPVPTRPLETVASAAEAAPEPAPEPAPEQRAGPPAEEPVDPAPLAPVAAVPGPELPSAAPAGPEPEVSEAPVPDAPPTQAPPTRPEVAPAMVCGQLGGFEDRASAAALAEQLRSSGVAAELLEATSSVPSSYWALIAPARDRAAARATVARLREAQVEDLWLIPSGPLQHAISLGLYSTEGRAERRAREIRALGLDVQVRPKYPDDATYRVRYRTTERRAASLEVAATAHAGIDHSVVPCPAIAPSEGVP